MRSRLNWSLKVSGSIIIPSATACRARMRLEQAEAVIRSLTAAFERISSLFRRAPAAKFIRT